MPADIRVISWNYDQQFERSFAEFIPESAYDARRAVDAELQVVPSVGSQREFFNDIFSIFKLNGSAGVRVTGETMTENPDAYIYQDLDDPSLACRAAIRFYDEVTNNRATPHLKFAWEHDSRRATELARINMLGPVDTVVVIGYSFPLFNRDIDHEILDTLSPREVYVQVACEHEAVADRLMGIGFKSKTIKVIRDQDQFYIPSTYSPKTRLSWSTRHDAQNNNK